MLTLEVQVTGSKIGSDLKYDEEELAYALDELANDPPSSIASDVAEHIPYGENEKVGNFLRNLADAIDPTS